jgi:hypothetical protein
MAAPDLTAEATLYRPSRSYRTRGHGGHTSADPRVLPQDYSQCGNCTCDPGKCCTKSGDDCLCYLCLTGPDRASMRRY